MGTPDEDLGYLAGGRLAYGCSTLVGTFPYDGTEVGLVSRVFLRPQSQWVPLVAEESGATAEVLWIGGDVIVSMILTAPDPQGIGVFYPNATALAGGDNGIAWPGSSVIPGERRAAITNLVFKPNNPDHPGFLIYYAYPLPELNQELAFQAAAFHELPVLCIAKNDGSGVVGVYGKFSKLSL